eukprot:68566_1
MHKIWNNITINNGYWPKRCGQTAAVLNISNEANTNITPMTVPCARILFALHIHYGTTKDAISIQVYPSITSEQYWTQYILTQHQGMKLHCIHRPHSFNTSGYPCTPR